MNKICFDFVADQNSQILILGSFPSEKSLKENFYYGNKSNKFWKVLAEYFNEKLVQSIAEKKQFLLAHKIAIWDIVKSTNLIGSNDSALQKEKFEINDIASFLRSHKNVRAVFCNGKTCHKIASQAFSDINFIYLPSTSPANVSFSKQVWFDALDSIFK